VHVPSALAPSFAVHTAHAAEHGESQHTPFAAYPLKHALAAVDGWPFISPQPPSPLHVAPLGQLSCGSVLAFAGEHVPLVPPGACSCVEQA
jgi:hypothetical protein